MPHLFERSDNVSRLFVATLLLALTSGCGGAGSYVWVHDLPRQPATAAQIERIRPGDLLSVRVFSQEAVSTKGRVRPDGTFTLPLVGELSVSGQRPSALAKQLEKRLTPYINAPSVTVVIDEAPIIVTVMGEVKAPTVAQLESPPTVVQAIARAGGLTEFADEDDIFVLRQAAGSTQRIRFTYQSVLRGEYGSAEFRLQSGDVVVVE